VGSEGTLQIYLNINCYSSIKQNNVLYSVFSNDHEFWCNKTVVKSPSKKSNNIVQYSANCACYMDVT